MDPLLLLALVIAALVGAAVLANKRQTKALEQRREDELRPVLKVADEDTTRFGTELQDLDAETAASPLDAAARQDYQRALDSYENAKLLLLDASTPHDVQQVTKTLEDGRYALACVQARVAGEPLPTRRPPCFFNPAQGPAQTDVMWAPAGGEQREIPVCLADADRLQHGAEPDTRQVRSGNRMVPWYDGGPAYQPYAGGYYGAYALNGMFPAFILGSMMFGGGIWDGSYDAGFQVGLDAGGDGGDGGRRRRRLGRLRWRRRLGRRLRWRVRRWRVRRRGLRLRLLT